MKEWLIEHGLPASTAEIIVGGEHNAIEVLNAFVKGGEAAVVSWVRDQVKIAKGPDADAKV